MAHEARWVSSAWSHSAGVSQSETALKTAGWVRLSQRILAGQNEALSMHPVRRCAVRSSSFFRRRAASSRQRESAQVMMRVRGVPFGLTPIKLCQKQDIPIPMMGRF